MRSRKNCTSPCRLRPENMCNRTRWRPKLRGIGACPSHSATATSPHSFSSSSRLVTSVAKGAFKPHLVGSSLIRFCCHTLNRLRCSGGIDAGLHEEHLICSSLPTPGSSRSHCGSGITVLLPVSAAAVGRVPVVFVDLLTTLPQVLQCRHRCDSVEFFCTSMNSKDELTPCPSCDSSSGTLDARCVCQCASAEHMSCFARLGAASSAAE